MKLHELEESIQNSMFPSLKPYFDRITIDNCSNWIMKVRYGHKDIYESFETYELDSDMEFSEFQRKKTRLFHDGVALYYVNKDDQIELICKITIEEYYNLR